MILDKHDRATIAKILTRYIRKKYGEDEFLLTLVDGWHKTGELTGTLDRDDFNELLSEAFAGYRGAKDKAIHELLRGEYVEQVGG